MTTLTTTPTTPPAFGLGASEELPLLGQQQHHLRHLSLDLSSPTKTMMSFTRSENGKRTMKNNFNQHHHRRWGSASSAPGGGEAFCISPMRLSMDHEEIVEPVIHPLLVRSRPALADIIHSSNSGGALVQNKPLVSCRASRKARLQQRQEKKQGKNLQEVSTRASITTCLSVDLTSPTRNINRQQRRRRASTGQVTLKPVQTLFRTVTSAVESFQARHRRASTQRRISETLLTLRAASELRQQQGNASVETPRGHLSDVGSALFSPLSPLFAEQRPSNKQQPLVLKHSTTTATTPELSIIPTDINKEQHYVVPIVPEVPELLNCNPRLLSQEMFQQLFDEGIPECLRMHQWERIFSIDRDGDSFQTMLNHCRSYQHTILVVKTSTGHILGGFASDPWQEQEGYSERHSYYGTGLSFLFANHPVLEKSNAVDVDPLVVRDESKPLVLFPWTGDNDFCQICSADKRVIAMGGSGAFGLILEDDFYVGSTDRCGTFGNPPLTPDKDGIFCVESMEIYGLAPYGGMFSSLSSPTCVTQIAAAVLEDHPRNCSKKAGVMNQGSFGQFLRT